MKTLMIYPDRDPEVKDLEFDEIRDEVGGWLEVIRYEDPDAVILADEDGNMKRLDPNGQAWLLTGRPLVGTVAVVGDSDGEKFGDVPQQVIEWAFPRETWGES
jgi:hypothetical protein